MNWFNKFWFGFKKLFLRENLKQNKIYFETVTATLLSVMAITISLSQVISGCRQEGVERLSQYGELSNAINSIIDQIPSLEGDYDLHLITPKERITMFQNIEKILISQIRNRILNENRDCLAHWNTALYNAQVWSILKTLDLDTNDAKEKLRIANCFLDLVASDVFYVRNNLIFTNKQFPHPLLQLPKTAEKEQK